MDTFNNSGSFGKKTEPLPVTSEEEKGLRRVFDKMCNTFKKVKIEQEIKDIEAYQFEAKLKVDSQIAAGIKVNMEKVNEQNNATQSRMENLAQDIKDLDENKDKSISNADVTEILKRLGHKPNKYEVEEMIWEVDEDLDSCLTWPEFKLMYNRNIMDQSGLEPSRMYNLTQFLIYDSNNNGMVSVDETMKMIYARNDRNKDLMETKLKELFGSDLIETGTEGGEISFPKFLKAVEKVQLNAFKGTTKGRILASKGGLKKSGKKQ
jgi:Ca2+-binding EF-hand superfamily protein